MNISERGDAILRLLAIYIAITTIILTSGDEYNQLERDMIVEEICEKVYDHCIEIDFNRPICHRCREIREPMGVRLIDYVSVWVWVVISTIVLFGLAF